MSDILAQALAIVAPALVGLLALMATWAISRAAAFFQAKTANETAKGAIDRVKDAAVTTVATLQTRTVDALKAASLDGRLTPAEVLQLSRARLALIEKLLGGEAKAAALVMSAGVAAADVKDVLDSHVEAAVPSQSAPVTVFPTPYSA